MVAYVSEVSEESSLPSCSRRVQVTRLKSHAESTVVPLTFPLSILAVLAPNCIYYASLVRSCQNQVATYSSLLLL